MIFFFFKYPICHKIAFVEDSEVKMNGEFALTFVRLFLRISQLHQTQELRVCR